MSIALNNRTTHSSFHVPLSLASAVWSTLKNKIGRDGPAKFGRALFQLCLAEQPLATIARHCEIIAFFRQPIMAAFRSLPIANKYRCDYLAKSFDQRMRRDILLHHYRSMMDAAAPVFFSRIFTDPYLLWSKEAAGGSYAIRLAFNKICHYEGDLSVVFTIDDRSIFEISFAIVPGSSIGSPAPELLFISRVQGVINQLVEIKRATKACGDVAPRDMLMVSINAIARALGIAALAGVTNEEQLSKLPTKDFSFDYNAFWENWVERSAAHGFYEIPVPLPQTALTEIEPRHRHRTRKRREFKQQVAIEIARNLHGVFQRSGKPAAQPQTGRAFGQR